MAKLQTRNDMIEHGDLSALVCIDEPEMQAIVFEHLSPLGFGIHCGLYPEEASVKLRTRAYDIIVTAERFAGADAQTSPILSLIAELSLIQRRDIFVVLIGPSLTSRSAMQAFMYSVDLVVNEADAENLKSFVGRGITQREEAYGAFNTVWRAVRAA